MKARQPSDHELSSGDLPPLQPVSLTFGDDEIDDLTDPLVAPKPSHSLHGWERQTSWDKKLEPIHKGQPLAPVARSGVNTRQKNVVAAFVTCGICLTGGISLGAIIFPSDASHPNTEFRIVGMQIGLLGMCLSQWVLCWRSKINFCIAGGSIPPVVAISSTFFAKLGPEEPHTVLFALPLITFFTGVLIYLAPRFIPLGRIVKGIPFTVFGGFMAGSGVLCIQYGMAIVWPPIQYDPLSLATGEALKFWLPPFLLSVLVYRAQEMGIAMEDTVLPLSLAAMTAAFYATLWLTSEPGTGLGLEAARADGWLFNIEIPSSPTFYRVWELQDLSKVRWDKLCCTSMLTAIIQCFALCSLTMVEDLYSIAEMADLQIDLNKEVETGGVCNIVCGLFGSMPTNAVLSYSLSAYKSGASSDEFLIYTAIISTVFFVLGDYAIAVLPKMVPAAAMIWVGIALCWEWIYRGASRLSTQDYAVVWVMVILNVTSGAEVMLLGGLFVSLLQLAHRLSCMEVIACETSSMSERSDTLRTVSDDALLARFGNSAMIIHVSKVILFFGSAHQIQERVEHRLLRMAEPESEPLTYLVLNLQNVLDAEISGVKTLYAILDIAKQHNVQVVTAGMNGKVQRKIARFDADCPVTRFDSMNQALDFVERGLIRVKAMSGFHLAMGTTLNPDLRVVDRHVRAIYPQRSAVRAVGVDIHAWLNNYVESYNAEQMLPILLDKLQVQKFGQGHEVAVTGAGNSMERAPLIWLLNGEIAVANDPGDLNRELQEKGVLEYKHSDSAGSPISGDFVQRAKIADNANGCAGPLNTMNSFFTGFQMPPVAVYVMSSTAVCACLMAEDFDQLPTDVATLVRHYCARKRFSQNALAGRFWAKA